MNVQPNPNFGESAGVIVGPGKFFNNDKETEVSVYQDCKKAKVSFWTVDGGTHFNFFNRDTFDRAWDFIQ